MYFAKSLSWELFQKLIIQKLIVYYLDEVETLDEVDIDEDVDTELEVETLKIKQYIVVL